MKDFDNFNTMALNYLAYKIDVKKQNNAGKILTFAVRKLRSGLRNILDDFEYDVEMKNDGF